MKKVKEYKKLNSFDKLDIKNQKDNLKEKRRIGLGVLGYGSALLMSRIKYGSKKRDKVGGPRRIMPPNIQ